MANTDRRIHISWASSLWLANRTDGVRLRISADSANLMSPKIFAYQEQPLNPATGDRVFVFDHICSPADLEEYPEDLPIPNRRPSWLRLDYVDVIVRSQHEANDFLRIARADTTSLKYTLDIMDVLIPGGDEWIGEPPDSSSSSDSSSHA